MIPVSTTTRLHITPLTPELLPSVLPTSIQPAATEISFHCIPTFPEKNYGYVTLPTMEAEKIRKKLNGSILKGKKFKVEVARPQKKRRSEDDAAPQSKAATEKTSKKRKTDNDTIEGYELPPDRQVKRGWTESATVKNERRKSEKQKKKKKEKGEKEAKVQAKSKYTEKAECLFRTKVPPNRASSTDPDHSGEKRRKKKKSSQETVVHEFSKTVTYPSFLRSDGEGSKRTATFEEGKGWLDDSGNIIEPTNARIKNDNYRPGQLAGAKEKRKSAKISPKQLDSSARESEGIIFPSEKEKTANSENDSDDWTSSSGLTSSDEDDVDSDSDSNMSSSSDESSVSSSCEESHERPQGSESETPREVANSINATSGETDVSVVSSQPREESNQPPFENVHPLEALFKRPAQDSSESRRAEANTQFSFFGNDADIEDDESGPESEPQPVEPQTPFTKKDIQLRGIRSAAPTPDTALASRIKWNSSDNTDDSQDSGDNETTDSKHKQNTPVLNKEESEFSKWFWEHRGENNRAWKRRRREVAKEQRQKENRRTGMKGKS
ncbi:hypothetical protein MAP00_003221 [Monascus purpureus]|nr:hypothetical protein MAP00_003221 [Monascus purpureus]